MDIAFVAIAFFILLAIVVLLLFLIRGVEKKEFLATDGSSFKNQNDLELYERLYEKTKPLFSDVETNSTNQSLLGFDKSFLSKLRNDGFDDLKTIVNYRKQFQLLSDLIKS
tara:strand:- start:1393 stop:1725 length:333 start_codon:yes stop_codon:yes gene_type:complete